MKSRIGAAAVLSAAGWLAMLPATAQTGPATEEAIRAALAQWTADFNARDTSRICDLFAPDLVYDYRGFPERDFKAMCSQLHRALGDPSKRLAYTFDIKEIIVFGSPAKAPRK